LQSYKELQAKLTKKASGEASIASSKAEG